MALKPFSMIHLGKVADLDPIEGNSTVENRAGLVGTYHGASSPAYRHITTVTANNTNNNSITEGNGSGGGETLTYDVGSGTVTTVLDFAATVNMRVTFTAASGQVDYVGLGGIIQTAAGDLFMVMIDDDAGLGANALNDAPVLSLQVISVQSAGQNQNAAASDGQQFVTCFARGTRILTARGLIAVDALQVGDLVQTAGHGLQAIQWISTTRVSAGQMAENPRLRPIRITAGALGQGLPTRDLLVSQQHRMLAAGPTVQRMFKCPEVFIAAVKLTETPGISVDHSLRAVDYFHLLLARHEVIFAEGAPTESFYPGAMAMAAVPQATRQSLIFMLRGSGSIISGGKTAVFVPDGRLQKEFVARCLSLRKPVLDLAPIGRGQTLQPSLREGRLARPVSPVHA